MSRVSQARNLGKYFLYAKPDRTKVQVCKDYPIQLFTGRLFLYGQLLYPPLPNTEDYGKRGANQ